MDRALLVSAGIALLGALLTVLYLPKTNSSLEVSHTGEREEGSTIGTE
jgi:hypothetical protein